MWTKVAWLTLWMTLAFWYGCGNQPGLRVNAEDAPIGGEHRVTSAPPSVARPATADAPSAPAAAHPAAGRSVTGLDRTQWERTTVAPVRGRVAHHPIYFRSDRFLAARSRTSPLTADGDIEREATLATDNDDFAITGPEALRIAAEPLTFAADVVLWPVRAVGTPPWSTQYSPQ